MKTRALYALPALLFLTTGALAIDRDARMIDTVSLNLAALDDVDSIGGSIWGETAIAQPRKDWSLLFGFGYDELSPDNARNVEAWTGGFGLKYYLTEFTSFSGVGTYTRYIQGRNTPDRDAKAATLSVKHRFQSADAPVSPFLKGAVTWRDRSTFSHVEPDLEDRSVSELLVALIGGVEFRMTDTWSFVVEVGYVEADASSNRAENLDGPIASLAMQYYFPKPRL